jgi:transcriptional regulator with PAS, ATPase and Fis domain
LDNTRTRLDPPIVGSSPATRDLRESVLRLADTPSSVLVTGESGTGKELIARNLHTCSRRAGRPFVPVNCAALNPGVLESELFGHGKGSFTGAIHSYAGLFEQAEGGTLFLDEIGEIPLFVQAKLLRVLQDREIRRMGTAQVRRVDVRIVSATNVDLEERIENGSFRLDLFYRLNVFTLRVPALRERVSEIPELVDHFFAARGFPRRMPIGEEALALFSRYAWPGNVRELENEIERIAVLHPRAAGIEPHMLSDRITQRPVSETVDVHLLYDSPLPRAVGYLEESLVRKTLASTNWNKTQTARRLGLSRQGLLKKIKRYGIEKDPDATGGTD